MISNAELEAWLKERRRVKAFLQSCPLLKLPKWDREVLAVAADWALERGWESAEEWFDYINPDIVRRDLKNGIDPERHVISPGAQPVWKTIWTTDVWRLRVDWTGVYPAELEIAEEDQPYEDEDQPLEYLIYTVQLEQQKLVDGHIVPISWTPEWVGTPSSREEWFIDRLDAVARSAGTPGDVKRLIELLCSDDPRALASAYIDIVGHFGPHEFDSYPVRLTEDEFNERWES